jgi:hypothetical protein
VNKNYSSRKEISYFIPFKHKIQKIAEADFNKYNTTQQTKNKTKQNKQNKKSKKKNNQDSFSHFQVLEGFVTEKYSAKFFRTNNAPSCTVFSDVAL